MLIETLALKRRPEKWDEVCGQDKVVNRLKKMVKAKKIPRALLFTGSSGTGKTTLAYLLASYINKGNTNDVVHINGGGDEGKVEAIRELIQSSKFKPLNSKHKIIIVDEAQKLSNAAADALLTPLENDKTDCIFIFCSMEPEKLKSAFFTRCSVFQLENVSETAIKDRILEVAKLEKFKWLKEEHAELIAKNSIGSARNAMSQLEALAQAVEGLTSKKEIKEEIKTTIENLSGNDETDLAQAMLLSIYRGKDDKFQKSLLSVSNLVGVLNLMLQLNMHCINKTLADGHKNISRWPLLTEFHKVASKKLPSASKLMQIHEDIHNAKQSVITTSSDSYAVAIINFRKHFKSSK